MASTINADDGVISGIAGVKTTADSTGALNIQTNGTTAISISAAQAVSLTNSPTFTGGTANGVLYLNASKVATSGSALVFDGSTFGITSSAVSTGNINSTNANGSAFIFQNSGTSVGWVGNGSSSFVGASASNFGINGQTNLLFGVSGFEKARIDSSGNLGIGTASPISAVGGSVTAAGVFAASGYLSTHQTSKAVIEWNANVSRIRSYGATASTGVIAFNVGGGGGSTDSEAMRIDALGNLLVGTTTASSKFDVYQPSAARIQSLIGSSNTQGAAYKLTIVRHYPVVSTGTKLIIPFVSQGNLNSTTMCRVMGHSAIYNLNIPYGFTVDFAVGHLGALYNLASWNTGGNFASIAVNGMNVEITFTSAYTGATANGVYVTIEYMTNIPVWSIDVANIAMN